MIELEGNGLRIEPRVDCVQNGAAHRNAVVGFQHRRDVRQQHRHRMPPAHTFARERRAKLARAGIELAIRIPK